MKHLLSPHLPEPNGHARVAPGRSLHPSTMVGDTPVQWISEPFGVEGTGFWAKLEGFNPGGMKDRPAMHMVECGRARGDLPTSGRIIESTSGTLGLGLALAANVYGHPLTLVTDPGMEPMMHHLLTAYGADVDVVDEPHPIGGWQQARRDRVAELLAIDPTAWYPDQYNNPDNVDAYEPLGRELIAQLGSVDVLVCSVGTGGHSAGVARVLRGANPDLRLIGVDTIGSTIFGQPAAPRLMRGLGSSIHPGNVDYGAFDEVHWVAPDEAVWACRTLAATHYSSGGWSVGAVALVAGWVARTRPSGTTIVAVFADGPQRYFDTIFSDDYCRANDLIDREPSPEPAVVAHPGERVVQSWTRCEVVLRPNQAVWPGQAVRR